MSFSRTIVAFAVLAATASWLCASPPIQETASAAGPLERRATMVTAQNPVPRLTHVVMPRSPAPAPPTVVALRVTLDEQGRVGEVRALGPGSERYSFYVSRPMGGEVLAFTPITDQMAPRPIFYEALMNAAMNAVRQWQYEPPRNGPIVFNVLFRFDARDVRLLSNGATADPTPGNASAAAPTMDLPPDWSQSTVRVIGNDAPAKLNDVPIDYPPIAQSARVQGVVTIEARVERDGHVSAARVVTGPPLLNQVAREAAA
jgi:hypothetical protein